MTVVAIPYVPMPLSQNPNVKRGGSEVYMVSSFVTLASLRRWNPGLELMFVSNELPDPEWVARFRNIDVEIKIVPFSHRPPNGFAEKFLGSIYLLDVISSLDSDYLCIVDPDVFCIGDVRNVLVDRGYVSALNIPSPREQSINGLSPRQADSVHASLGEPRTVDFHYGGEFYGIPRALREKLVPRIDQAWAHALRAWSVGEPYFTTEEHVMNFALSAVPVVSADDIVRRIWTAHRHRTVRGDEGSLLLWHLPSEKQRGFRTLFEPAMDANSWFWRSGSAEFVKRSGREFGLSNRKFARLAKDEVGSLRNAFCLSGRDR